MPKKKPSLPIPVGIENAAPVVTPPAFITAGTETSKIPVQISFRIIELFSQGLYRSPTKAIEELVSNAFDAGATKVHVALDADLVPADATIVVIDNGCGMNAAGLRQHWRIGVSEKQSATRVTAEGRHQIGRFGIGKLATYVLAGKLTHIAKSGGKYFATTMDYNSVPNGDGGGIHAEKPLLLPLRELTKAEAKDALDHWLDRDEPACEELKLFGPGAETTWTAAILSDLKPMARVMSRAKLRWVLSTAMPIRDDFKLFLDGNVVPASKLKGRRLRQWILGKQWKELPKPSPQSDALQPTEDKLVEASSPERFGLTHPSLGRVTGYAELFEELLTGGKSSEEFRSHGFFVYVRGRLINQDDEYFGIDSNKLRHGTFARFRMVLNADRLDQELNSSRETVRDGPLVEIARNLLEGAFKAARTVHAAILAEEEAGTLATTRIAATPASLARRPLVTIIGKAIEGKYSPLLTTFPKNLTDPEKTAFVNEIAERAASKAGLVSKVELVDRHSDAVGIASFDAATGILSINALHPYIAHFLDEYENKTHVPLELLAMSEVLLEGHLFERGLDEKVVKEVLLERDELFRVLSRATSRRNSRLIAQDLLDASANKNSLEIALVAAFDSMGFHDPVRIGGSGKPDGFAEARLSATPQGEQRYRITLEAKSKEDLGKKVSAKAVGISTVVRHRKDYNATYSVVVGPDFPTGSEASALSAEIKYDRELNIAEGLGITLIRIEDMARLVRLVPAKRIGLHRLRELFATCSTPEESKAWIDKITNEKMEIPPYRELLDAIQSEQDEMPNQPIEFMNVVTALRRNQQLRLDKSEVIDLCKSLSKMVPDYLVTREMTVELMQRPDIILKAMAEMIRLYPIEERKKIAVPK